MVGKVFIVDDDDAVRKSLQLLLKSAGLQSQAFASGDEFLHSYDRDWQGCILLDVRMPGTSGLEVQEKLVERGNTLPIIFITGHADIPMAVEAMQHGAYDFVQKPFRDQDLMDRVRHALEENTAAHAESEQLRDIAARYDKLTPREKEVMQKVVSGLANKVIALDLEVSQRTVEIHRARVMEKMEARSLAALVRMALALEKQFD